MDKEQKPLEEIVGVFANCEIFNPDSKSSYIYFDSNGEIKEISNFKKDVSHIYGVRRLIGVEVENTPNEIGVRIRGFQEKLPAIAVF